MLLVLSFVVMVGAAILLLYAAKVDMEKMIVEYWMPGALSLLGVFYVVLRGFPVVEVIGVLFFTAVVIGLPTLLGYGVGDFFLFISLGLFLGFIEQMWIFYGILCVCYVVWQMGIWVMTHEKVSRKMIMKTKRPLVPAIAVTFIIWMVMQVVSVYS